MILKQHIFPPIFSLQIVKKHALDYLRLNLIPLGWHLKKGKFYLFVGNFVILEFQGVNKYIPSSFAVFCTQFLLCSLKHILRWTNSTQFNILKTTSRTVSILLSTKVKQIRFEVASGIKNILWFALTARDSYASLCIQHVSSVN